MKKAAGRGVHGERLDGPSFKAAIRDLRVVATRHESPCIYLVASDRVTYACIYVRKLNAQSHNVSTGKYLLSPLNL